jgi:hypothetical protein
MLGDALHERVAPARGAWLARTVGCAGRRDNDLMLTGS